MALILDYCDTDFPYYSQDFFFLNQLLDGNSLMLHDQDEKVYSLETWFPVWATWAKITHPLAKIEIYL